METQYIINYYNMQGVQKMKKYQISTRAYNKRHTVLKANMRTQDAGIVRDTYIQNAQGLKRNRNKQTNKEFSIREAMKRKNREFHDIKKH